MTSPSGYTLPNTALRDFIQCRITSVNKYATCRACLKRAPADKKTHTLATAQNLTVNGALTAQYIQMSSPCLPPPFTPMISNISVSCCIHDGTAFRFPPMLQHVSSHSFISITNSDRLTRAHHKVPKLRNPHPQRPTCWRLNKNKSCSQTELLRHTHIHMHTHAYTFVSSSSSYSQATPEHHYFGENFPTSWKVAAQFLSSDGRFPMSGLTPTVHHTYPKRGKIAHSPSRQDCQRFP